MAKHLPCRRDEEWLTRSTRELAEEITRYCAAHPEARDTLEGIAWWLTLQRCNDMLDDLRAAVASLVAQKVLVPYHLNDGTTVYGCSPEQRSHSDGPREPQP